MSQEAAITGHVFNAVFRSYRGDEALTVVIATADGGPLKEGARLWRGGQRWIVNEIIPGHLPTVTMGRYYDDED